MQKYDIHVCLISDQAAPNLLPILSQDFKPKKAIFFVSEKMKKNAINLKQVFKSKGVDVIDFSLSNVFDFEAIENEMLESLTDWEDKNIALNVTGGTKLMAIAAQNIFSMMEKPIFYLDTDQNRIVFVRGDKNEKLPSIQLETYIDIKTYLEAYGSHLLGEKENLNVQVLLPFVERFIQHYNVYKEAIPALNYLASVSENNTPKFTAKVSKTEANDILLDLNDEGILSFDGNTVDFISEDIKEYLNGGWLEAYTFAELNDIKIISDKKYNIEVGNPFFNVNKNKFTDGNLGNQNEFDVAFMAKNKLHIIECKTQDMNKKSEDILYKLETLKDYGGLMTKKCLVTYLEVPKQIRNRAKALNIEIIQGKDLQRLKIKIREWIGKK